MSKRSPAGRGGILGFFRARYLRADPRGLAVFRVLLGILLLVDLGRRAADLRTFYSNDGLLPNHYLLFQPFGSVAFSVYVPFSSVKEVGFAFALTAIAYVFFTVGYHTRLFHVISALCVTGLNARNPFVENGGTVVVNLLVVWTMFLPLGERGSVDAVLRSLRRVKEATAADLNQRTRSFRDVASLAMLALALQWSAIYLFNALHKTGEGWKNGSAIHWFLHQDRIVTALGIWMRENLSPGTLQVMTRGVIPIEYALCVLILMPIAQTWMRRLALLLAFALHAGIALTSRIGPFSYAMVLGFIPLLRSADWDLLGRWFSRPSRLRTVVFDADCGLCFYVCRVLKRFDPFERLRFVPNDDAAALATLFEGHDAPSAQLLDSTVVVVDAGGSLATEERAVFEIGRALPFGWLAFGWLAVPGLARIGAAGYRFVAARRQAISAWFGFGVCGVPAAAGQEPPPQGPRRRARLSITPLLYRSVTVLRELSVVVLLVAVAAQLTTESPVLAREVTFDRPLWLSRIIEYPRLFQGWGMFAPEPPYDDGHLVVDGRTRDGRKLDPLTGKEPNFDPFTREGWGLDQLWCDYENRIRLPHLAHHRQHLRSYLSKLHEYRGHPEDELTAFEVWWVGDKSPPPGEQRGEPEKPVMLLRQGHINDSGAQPWLEPTAHRGTRGGAKR